MEELKIKAPGSAMWDAASLGEIMLRLDPGDGRIHTARAFNVQDALAAGDFAAIETLAADASSLVGKMRVGGTVGQHKN